ncbi:MAG TPA: GTPase ObgE [Planctomycetota bacterium]|nr:GTPase ObgE [Planctomycetota bacterium]
MFIDETEISVTSGRGGDGAVSFRREKYIPHGGPDGGDGGRGGDVVLRANPHLSTLSRLQHRRRYRAGDGRPGGSRNCTGHDGESLQLEVPVGTLVRDAERGHVLRDLDRPGMTCVIVQGGAAGRGNVRFAHSTNQAPRRSTPGRPGETRRLRLELRLVADAGLVGLPNAGKSTFLARISAARPKVADYPFTTLQPMLGIAELGDDTLVVADLPGLIEGAHRGAGLGDRFLRHVARTRMLLHLVDATQGAETAVAAWRTVTDELRLAGLGLEDKPVVLAASRADAAADAAGVAAALSEASGRAVTVLSSQTGAGVRELLGRLLELKAEAAGKGSGPASSKA